MHSNPAGLLLLIPLATISAFMLAASPFRIEPTEEEMYFATMVFWASVLLAMYGVFLICK